MVDEAEQVLQKKFNFNESSKIIWTGVSFYKFPLAFPVQKNSPFRKIWNKYMSKMTSSGVLDRLVKMYWKEISREPDSSFPAINLSEVFTLFFFLCLGIFFSLICLVAERRLFSHK
ncbi:UNVERIFIED_CONTAM: hypothetical protein RMT77_015693 [Armadillidium vulgare]